MRSVIIDAETTKIINECLPTTIWCVACLDVDTKEVHTFRTSLFNNFIKDYDRIIGHNIVGFDAPVLRKVWGTDLPHEKLLDTLILSQLAYPSREGGHSLGSWGNRLKFPKGDHTDWSQYSSEMLKYCKRDTELTYKLYVQLKHECAGFSRECVQLEHDVKRITTIQERDGFFLDQLYSMNLVATLDKRLIEIREELQAVFPPKRIETQLKTKTKVEMQEFNVGSRKQIAERLQEKGWEPSKTTEKGSIIVDEAVLNTIDMPEAKLIAEYLMFQKRIAQVNSWIEALDKSSDDRVHGQVLTLRTITGRMAHANPNMAQVPASYSPYGSECRTCWTVPKGRVLVGIDASGIELRMLAHYLYVKNPQNISVKAYIEALIKGDIHSVHQKVLQSRYGPQITRDQAKTFVYAFLYGAGNRKLGSIVGKGAPTGKELKERLLYRIPNLGPLHSMILYKAGNGYLRGLDKRKLQIRSLHSALNSLLQSGAAIVMKKALIIFKGFLTDDVKIVANVHDEWQVECDEKDGDMVGKLGVTAIMKGGEHFKVRCPLAGEYKVGTNWSETH